MAASRRVLADEALDAIRTAILNGELVPGQRLIEEELSNQLQVSRGPVREALVRLEQEGLVVNERHRGATVTELSLAEAGEIYSLRTALERLAVEFACRNASDEDFAEIDSVLAKFEALPRPLTYNAVAILDVEFHDAVFRAAHHVRLYRSWIALRSQIAMFLLQRGAFREDFSTAWREEHEVLLTMLKCRQTVSAVKEIESHIEGTYRRMLTTT
jgi:DNA-binding GntR family transcriptional regulator